MMTPNTRRGIQIIAGIARIAHAVNQTFTKEQLNQLLELFDQHPEGSKDNDLYFLPDKLVLWTYNAYYATDNAETAEYVKEAFPWFEPKVDLSLLD